MADVDWIRSIANGLAGAAIFYFGRWSQRREDRRRAQRDLAETVRSFNAWKNRNRGA